MLSTRADTPQGQERAQVRAAEAGDPRAVREILFALEDWLRGESPMPRCYAVFCADSFKAFLEDEKAWGPMSDEYRPLDYPGANEEFEARDRSKDSPVETILGLGARLSERRLRRIGTAACRNLHLTRRRAGATERSRIEAPGDGSQTIRLTGHFDARAEFTTCAAQAGDPSALRKLLHAVECSLYEGKTVPGRYAYFCADALQEWLGDREAWERIESYVQGAGRGSKPPIKDLRPLARSFCRAFCLSRPKRLPRPGEIPREIVGCLLSVDQFKKLLAHGVTWRRSLSIVSGANPSLSSRTLDEWARLKEISCRAVGEDSLMANRLALAERVALEIAQGRSQEDAELEVARWLAQQLFPCGTSRVELWAEHVLQESEVGGIRPAEQVKLARRIQATDGAYQVLLEIPSKLFEEIVPEVYAEETDTFLPDPLIAELIPAIRSAQALAARVVIIQ